MWVWLANARLRDCLISARRIRVRGCVEHVPWRETLLVNAEHLIVQEAFEDFVRVETFILLHASQLHSWIELCQAVFPRYIPSDAYTGCFNVARKQAKTRKNGAG